VEKWKVRSSLSWPTEQEKACDHGPSERFYDLTDSTASIDSAGMLESPEQFRIAGGDKSNKHQCHHYADPIKAIRLKTNVAGLVE
jgi:hypothetical protein